MGMVASMFLDSDMPAGAQLQLVQGSGSDRRMLNVLLITPLIPESRAAMEHCDVVERALATLKCSPRRLDVRFPEWDSSPWWKSHLEAFCGIHDAVVLATHHASMNATCLAAFRMILARIPPRTVVWVADKIPETHNSLFEAALRQDLNVFLPAKGEAQLSVQVLEFLNYLHFTQSA